MEIGLLCSTMVTDTGLELRIPNKTILNAAIVDYTPSYSDERLYQVRYELKVDYDPELVLTKVREALSDITRIKTVLLNEQSDKDYYIVLIEFKEGVREDWRGLRSTILARLIRIHRSLRSDHSLN